MSGWEYDFGLTIALQIIAEEIAADELAHVVYLRTALGADAVAMPLVRSHFRLFFTQHMDHAKKVLIFEPIYPVILRNFTEFADDAELSIVYLA